MSVSSFPFPATNLRHVPTVLVDVLLVLDQLVLERKRYGVNLISRHAGLALNDSTPSPLVSMQKTNAKLNLELRGEW
jgi:hypothetical protein